MPSSTSPSSSDGDLPVDVEKRAGPIAAEHEASHYHHPSKKDEEEHDNGGSLTDPAREEEEELENWRIQPEPDILNTEADGVAGTVSRVLSRISTKSSWNPGPPPDGGRVAWLACEPSFFFSLPPP